MKLMITGGAGFVGSHIVEGILKDTDWDIVIIDRLDISGNLERLTDMSIWEIGKDRVKFIWWDLKAELNNTIIEEIGHIDYIWHLAASSHVDRSIIDPLSFVMDNVVGTCNILNYARKVKPKLFFYFGTDEVFGPALKGIHKEWDKYHSGNPYAATKMGAEELCLSFHNTYGLPLIVTHSANIFGEKQHPEKFIPLVVKKILAGEKVLIHADKTKTKSGDRMWIHARNVCKALQFLTKHGEIGEKYNIIGEKQVSNLEMAQIIADIIGKPLKYELVDYHSTRPGHDLRYTLDGTKMRDMGWHLPKSFKDSLTKTIKWTLKNERTRPHIT